MSARIRLSFKGADLSFDPLEFTPRFCREFRQEFGLAPRAVVNAGTGVGDDLDTRVLMAAIYYRMHHDTKRTLEMLEQGVTYNNTSQPVWVADAVADDDPPAEPVNEIVASEVAEVAADPETQGDDSPT